jgi:hypothetical protein
MGSLTLMLRIGLAVAALVAVVGLSLILRRSAAFGRRTLHAEAKGSEADGIRYAFVEGMLPWAKESTRQHLPTYVSGLFYHLSIFVSLALLVLTALEIALSPAITLVVQSLVVLGLACGVGLLVKRLFTSSLRSISTPDDSAANLLVDLFLAATLASSYYRELTPALYLTAILLFLYIPFGKIRHCALFFISRVIFGKYFGRRGVLPHSAKARA